MSHNENIVIINFTDRKVLTTGTVLPRNPRWWKGEIEPRVTHVLADDQRIIDAYAKAGVPEYKDDKSATKTRSKCICIEIPEDIEDISWPKLRSLACYLAPEGVKVKNMEDAMRVIHSAV